jgi:hypothetical protein
MSEIQWFVLAASDRSELGRVTAPDRREAESAAKEAFPDISVVVQSVASAACAALEPSPSSRIERRNRHHLWRQRAAEKAAKAQQARTRRPADPDTPEAA